MRAIGFGIDPQNETVVMIRIGRSSVVCSDRAKDHAALAAEFNHQHYLRLSELLDPGLLHSIQLEIDRGEFYKRVHKGIGNDLCLKGGGSTAFGALLFLMNDEELFQIIQDITKCARIGCFDGRVYRVTPGQGHRDSWHDDQIEQRLVGLTLNLSKEVYDGGILQIRDRNSGKILSEVANVGIGDAVVFRLSSRLEHRITEVKGKASKTAFAGWFRAKPDFLTLLKGEPNEVV